jgi:hypothetical protein
MAKTQAVGLQRRTVSIMNDFFNDIDKLKDKNLSSYQMNLSIRVKKFFDAMHQLGEQEFARLLEKHQFKNTDAAQQAKYTDAFNCLVAYIVAEYTESDLLRYFLPEKYSIEDKPIKFDSNIIIYWAKFLTYWLGSKLFNRQKFKMDGAEGANESLEAAIKAIKQDLNEKSYYDLQQNDTFKQNLETVVGKFVEKHHIVNDEHVVNDASSNGDVPEQVDNLDENFRKDGFDFKNSRSTTPEPTVAPLPPPSPIASSSTTELAKVLVVEEPIAIESGSSERPKANVFRNFLGLFKSNNAQEEQQQPPENSFTP